jgi:hypothetical protein
VVFRPTTPGPCHFPAFTTLFPEGVVPFFDAASRTKSSPVRESHTKRPTGAWMPTRSSRRARRSSGVAMLKCWCVRRESPRLLSRYPPPDLRERAGRMPLHDIPCDRKCPGRTRLRNRNCLLFLPARRVPHAGRERRLNRSGRPTQACRGTVNAPEGDSLALRRQRGRGPMCGHHHHR